MNKLFNYRQILRQIIHAELPEGVSEKTARDITENCHPLRFESFGFEKKNKESADRKPALSVFAYFLFCRVTPGYCAC
jgi:hypothetical protein